MPFCVAFWGQALFVYRKLIYLTQANDARYNEAIGKKYSSQRIDEYEAAINHDQTKDVHYFICYSSNSYCWLRIGNDFSWCRNLQSRDLVDFRCFNVNGNADTNRNTNSVTNSNTHINP